jgi:dihydroorotate dehydrogenase (fumarate)
MLASALYKRGPDHLRVLLEGVRAWLEEKEYQSVEQMKGSVSQENSADPSAFERSNYIKTLTTFIGPAIWGRAEHPSKT